MRSQPSSTNGKVWVFAVVVALGIGAYLVDQSKRKRERFRTDTTASVFELTTESISRSTVSKTSSAPEGPSLASFAVSPTPEPSQNTGAGARSPVCRVTFEPLKTIVLDKPDRYMIAANALANFESTPECLKLNGNWSFPRHWESELRTTCVAKSLDAVHLLRCDAILTQLISLARLSETSGGTDLRSLSEQHLMALGRLSATDRRWSEGRTRELHMELKAVADELLRRDPKSYLAREYTIAAELASLRDGDPLAADRLRASIGKFNKVDDPLMLPDNFYDAPSSSLERVATYEAATRDTAPAEGIERMREMAFSRPEDPVARLYLARVLMREGRVDEAKAELREAAHLAPFDPFVQENVRVLNEGDGSTEIDLGMIFDQ